MNKFDDSINEERFQELISDLSSVRINDVRFSDEEKLRGQKRLLARMKRHDAWQSGLRWAAAVVVVVATAGGFLYINNKVNGVGGGEQVARVVPADNDILLTTTDGLSMSLRNRSELVCDTDGCISVDGGNESIAGRGDAGGTENGDVSVPAEKMCGLVVPDGKRTSVRLSDGSRLWVNSGSEVEFPVSFKGNERRIKVNGEIYIEVAHNANKPFRVQAEGFEITVLGTKFGVTAYSRDRSASVVLAEGAVAVEVSGKPVANLRPSQLLTLCDGVSEITQVDPYTYISWKDDLLYFSGTPISEVLQRLSHQYAVNISCSTSVAGKRLYGKLVLEERIEDVLDNLSVISSISYEVKDNKIIVGD